MNVNETEVTGMDIADMSTDIVANDLTQLSSREQLSALMDGALSPDQTRFLLRRLQHDAPLAECWERWRLTGEVMRGLAPAQRLPADFASRVGAALRGDVAASSQSGNKRAPAWLRWGGGMGIVAASLMAVALIARQPAVDAPAAASVQLASSAPSTAVPDRPVSQDPAGAGNAAQTLMAASAVAAISRPARNRGIEQARAHARMQPAVVRNNEAQVQVAASDNMLDHGTPIPQPDIVTRPWPRSVLPQYASGGLTVGFGDHARGAVPYNPFQAQASIGNLPPISNASGSNDAAREPQATTVDPQREPQHDQ